MTVQSATREQWLEARLALLEEEKALQRARDRLAQKRRTLPLIEITEDYHFEAETGSKSLADLFDGCSQLIVYHFMYGPDWQAGCPSCSFWADGYNFAVPHLRARDASLVAIASAPIAQLKAYKARMGWSFPFVSAAGNGFNRDFGVTFDKAQIESGDATYNFRKTQRIGEEMPGLSTFKKDDGGKIYHHYSTYARGLDPINPVYQMLDFCPDGRNEDGLDFTMAWVRRRDEYEAA